MRERTWRGALLAVALVAGGLGLAASPHATSAPRWASASSATIHPGVQMETDGAQCTANFVFTRGLDVLLGYAAHCAGTGAATDTNGCEADSLPLGTKVTIQGATRPGTLVYSSWLTMQKDRERNQDACEYNDLALVRIDPVDVRRVNPSVPHWGGPTGLGSGPIASGSSLYTYGSSELRLGLTQLSPKTGVSLGDAGHGWTHQAYTVSPGIPGDSGSGLLDTRGRASGVLSTIGLAPLPASNNFADLNIDLYYAAAKGFSGVVLVKGTVAFNPGQLPLGA
jgi:hypothetical protein